MLFNQKGTRFILDIKYKDDFDGGHTQFRVGGNSNDILNVAPKTGKLICFPASWYFYHRGETVTKGSKYVCTGWLSDHVTTFSNDTTGISPNFRETARKAGRKMLLQFNENTGRIEMDDDMKKQKQNADTFKGIDVLLGKGIDTSAKKFDVNSRTVLKKLGAQADRLEQIKNNFNAFVPPVEVDKLKHGKDLDLL